MPVTSFALKLQVWYFIITTCKALQKGIFLEQLASCDVMDIWVVSCFGYYYDLNPKYSADDLWL